MSYTTVSPNLHDPNASVHDEECSAFVVTTASDTSIYRNANLQPEVTIQVLNESSHNIKFGEIRSIASQVTLLGTFEAPEVVRRNEHLEREVSTRYVNVNSLANGSLIWKTDLDSFEDWYLADFFMEHVGNEDSFLNILINLMHSVKILPNTENGKSTWEFKGQHIMSQFLLVPAVNLFIVTIPMIAVDLCVWDPGIGFDFTVLTSYTVYNVKELLLLGLEWKEVVLRSGYKVKFQVEPPSTSYTLYGVLEMILWAARHRLHHGLDTALVFVILLNKCMAAGQGIPELHLIMSKSFTVNQRERDCNWLISVSMQRFGGRLASNTIHRYFKVNISIDRKGIDT
ncbi:hypothetical protein H5410_045504 [Solanum commersonii]|uniref:Uncharacterized protein n=1 Tax=Solanum commersonii TaxID=4109 RepID=A0A9J5XCW6_SOLCO|nr:hypothetical protein H5410_045504 [Solanum commersonii]